MTISDLATALFDRADAEDVSSLDLFHDAVLTLAPEDVAALALAMELCPIHHCDDQICADDADPECADLR